MDLHRLFHILVVQGSLIVACDKGDDGPKDPGPETTDDDGAAEGAPTAGDSATPDSGDPDESTDPDNPDSGDPDDPDDSGDPEDSDDSGEGPATTGDDSDGGTTTGGSSGEPPELECSEPPAADDQCGCPCCWVPDCVNEDECCAGFSDACTP